MVVSCLFEDFWGGAWLSIGVFVFFESVRFMMVSCSFHFFFSRVLVLYILRHLPMSDFVRCGLADFFGLRPTSPRV